VEDQVKKVLDGCPSKAYLLVQQAGVSSLDFVDGWSAPRLGRYLNGKEENVKSTMIVPEVLEGQSSESLSKYIQTKCGAEVLQGRPSKATAGGPYVIEVSFAAPSSSERSAKLAENGKDALLLGQRTLANTIQMHSLRRSSTKQTSPKTILSSIPPHPRPKRKPKRSLSTSAHMRWKTRLAGLYRWS
jgi:hypothetical protein